MLQDGQSLQRKSTIYICQNERTFRPSRYIALYNEGRIRYLFELVDAPYHNCNIHNTPILKTVDDLDNPEVLRQVIYLRFVANVGPIENDTVDKNGNTQAFTQGHRYTTLERIMKAKRTSELVEDRE